MTSPQRPHLTEVSPFFIVRELRDSVAFYRDRLGFHVALLIPEEDPFFAIVRRDAVELMLKAVDDGVGPLPNAERHPNARWDAFIAAPDPDALAAELAERGVAFSAPLADWDDGLRGFELKDHDGYVLFFGRPQPAPPEPARAEPRTAMPPRAQLDAVQPVLSVRDVRAAIQFYERLGFREAFRDDPNEPRYAGVRRDGVELHLQWHDASEWQYPVDRPNYRFPLRDPDQLFEELRPQLAQGDHTPCADTPWGTREFHLRDPDGNGLQFYRVR